MKIVHFGQKNCMTREGGVEVAVAEIAKREVALGHEVTCINRSSKHIGGSNFFIAKIKKWEGINIKYVPTIDIKGISALSSSFFASLLSAFGNYDIVHIHAEGPSFFSFIPRLFGKKVICHIHGIDWKRGKWQNSFASKFIKKGEENLVKCANSIIVLNETLYKYFKDNYNIKTEIVPNGVTKKNVIPAEFVNKKFGLEKNSYILYLSRLVPEKRCDLLIDAYNNINTEKKLVIAGSSSDTDDYYNELIAKSKNNKNIIFTGFVDGKLKEELYSNAYAYVLPSDLEGMPLSLLEALSYGNACLVSNIPESLEIIEKNGFVFDNGSLKSLENMLIYILDNNEEVESVKAETSDYVCNKYNWDLTVKKIIDIYEK